MPCNNKIPIVTANVRGFHINVAELTHRFILKNNADIVFVSETFLDDRVPEHYARVKGYSRLVQCYPLNFVGSSAHIAVLAKVSFKRHREECTLRTVWRWEMHTGKTFANLSYKSTGILCCAVMWTNKQDNSLRF